MGIEVVMITGDDKRTAEAIVKRVGMIEFCRVYLRIRQMIEASGGKKVAMVGDGIMMHQHWHEQTSV